MFNNLTQRLSHIVQRMSNISRLTEENIQQSLRDVRIALLEADVSLPVVRHFIEQVKQIAIGQKTSKNFTPGQALIKIVKNELINAMGEKNEGLNLKTTPPAIILMSGLQGAGKTTCVAKLARLIKNQKKRVLVASTDIYRPAAITQLETLAKEIDVSFFPSATSQTPKNIATAALQHATLKFYDVLIIDTAGRLHIDKEMMAEIIELNQILKPIETLFVVDAMTGQDAVNSAKAFDEALPLTGVILTKIDSDTRGGAALSVRHITGKPIKFMGTGEKVDALEAFHPDRIASRILGMGDVLSLIETIETKVDQKEAKQLAAKLKKSNKFDLNDFLSQLKQFNNLGNLEQLMDKLPQANKLPPNIKAQMDEKNMRRMTAIIYSMTPKERAHPEILKSSRKHRIAKGAGVQVQEINRLLKQFDEMNLMLKKIKSGGLNKLLGAFRGKMPPGFFPPR